MPAWNEAESVGDTVADVLAVSDRYDVLVVDDGSTDETASIAELAGATVLRLPFNLGVGGAMRAGFKYARRFGYVRVIQVDSDGQHDPRKPMLPQQPYDHARDEIASQTQRDRLKERHRIWARQRETGEAADN